MERQEIDKRTAELDFQIADNWRLTAVNEALKEQNAKLKEQVRWLKKGDVLHVLTDQEFADQQKREWEMRASINALEDKSARLRSCLSDDAENARQIMGENAKLRKLVEYMHRCYVIGHDWGPYGAPEKWWVEEQMRELGIEVPHD